MPPEDDAPVPAPAPAAEPAIKPTTNVAIPITMWVTILIAIATSGFNLYDRTTNLQFDNLKKDYETLKTETKEEIDSLKKENQGLTEKVNQHGLIIAGYEKDIDHMKETLDRVDRNVTSMNQRITNAEMGTAFKNMFREWAGQPAE